MKQSATLPTLRRQGAALTVLALAVVLAALAGLCFGSQGYTPLQLWQAWCSGDPQNAVYRVLLHVRWPRTLAGLLAGSALAAAGVLLQAVLNNAMASPNVIGVNAGAGLAALCAAALWPAHPNAVQPAAFAGALFGFLWYNCYPAQVFMGDTGSLAIGGIIAVFALLIRKELLLPILCGIFFIESLSVIMQVTYFKYTKKRYGEGRRIFLMSPLHHHFQKKGYFESKIVVRFWIVQLLLAAITLVTLKIR